MSDVRHEGDTDRAREAIALARAGDRKAFAEAWARMTGAERWYCAAVARVEAITRTAMRGET